MRLALLLVVFSLAVLFTSQSVSFAFALMNHSSDASVAFGLMILLVVGALWVSMLVYVKRQMINNDTWQLSDNGKRILNKLLMSMILSCSVLNLTGCLERVDAGYVGVKINYAGDDRGVESVPKVTGWVFYNPFTQTVFEYPTFVQTAVWTKDITEGSPTNEEMSFNSVEGMIINADVSMSYRLLAEKVPQFYVQFRTDNLNTFTHGFLRNAVRDAFNEVTSKEKIEDIYGPKKEEILVAVRQRLSRSLESIGVVIEQFGFVGAPRLPQNVVDALNTKVAATQQAITVENELRKTEAEAKKKIAQAEGEAKARISQAKGEAEATKLKADARAYANKVVSGSLTKDLITNNAIDKWDGKRPLVESGNGNNGLLLQLPLADSVTDSSNNDSGDTK